MPSSFHARHRILRQPLSALFRLAPRRPLPPVSCRPLPPVSRRCPLSAAPASAPPPAAAPLSAVRRACVCTAARCRTAVRCPRHSLIRCPAVCRRPRRSLIRRPSPLASYRPPRLLPPVSHRCPLSAAPASAPPPASARLPPRRPPPPAPQPHPSPAAARRFVPRRRRGVPDETRIAQGRPAPRGGPGARAAGAAFGGASPLGDTKKILRKFDGRKMPA